MWWEAHHSEEQQLIDQFFVTLDAIYGKMKQRDPSLRDNHSIAAQIETLLHAEKTWRNAYHIEQLMIPLLSQEEVDIELTKRMSEAKCNLDADTYGAYARLFGALTHAADSAGASAIPEMQIEEVQHGVANGFHAVVDRTEEPLVTLPQVTVPVLTPPAPSPRDDKKRTLLSRLVNDLQWCYELRQLRRVYGSQTRIRMGVCAIVSLIAFYLPYWVWHLLPFLHQEVKTYYVMTALTAGWMGASFSLVLSVKKIINQGYLEELKVIRRYPYILSRIIIGVGAAVMFFYFLQADFLQGSMFPAFTEQEGGATASSLVRTHLDKLREKDLALLIIWCFLAGFSEKLVPNMLSRTEAQVKMRAET